MRTAIGQRDHRTTGRQDRRHWSLVYGLALALLLLALCSRASAQLVVNYGFSTNTNIPDDGTSQYTTTHTLGGFATYTDVNVNLSLTTSDSDNPMFLGDLYSSLTLGLPSESSRAAVLLNRPGRDSTHPFGSSLSAFDVTLDDAAGSNVFGATSNGTYQSDGRGSVNPYGAAVDGGTRNHTLTDLNGSSLASNKFTLLVADTSAGGQATLSNWGMTVSGTAASSGTMTGDGGTFSIADTGSSGDSNDIGAALTITQAGGGALSVTLAGTTTFSGGVSGSGGLTKSGNGTLIINSAGTYSGTTTISAGTLQLGSGGTTGTLSTGGAIVDNGNFTINRSNAVAQGTDFSSSGITGTGSFTQNGSGTTTLNASNTFSGATTINNGAINAAADGALGSSTTGTSGITVNSGGTLFLSNAAASDRVKDTATITLHGGTLAIAPTGSGANAVKEGSGATAGFLITPPYGPKLNTIASTSTVGLGALTLTANSTLDFGASGVGTLVFDSFLPNGFTLTITNYASSATPTLSGVDGTDDRLIFNEDQSGNLAQFNFGGGYTASEIALDSGFWEVIAITAVPEPSTWLIGTLALGTILFGNRRRICRLLGFSQA